jgi:uncharacterized membrane protein
MTSESPWNEARVLQLPRAGRFYLRGCNMTRLETFVDAAFAFAVTLLVIAVDSVPLNYAEFVDALLHIPAFIASFFQLIMFWLGHRAWSRRYGLDDSVAVVLSLGLVAGVLVIVYPLRVIFSAGFGHLTEGALPVSFTVNLEEMGSIFAIYGIGFGTLCGVVALLFAHAWRQRDWLCLDETERQMTMAEVRAWCIMTAIGFLAFLIAMTVSGEWVVVAAWIYAVLVIVMPLHSRWEARRRRNRLIPDA